MAIQRGPKIVTDNLVLCLDASDKNSYPGTGTSWSNLTSNSNNATLVNGPTFNSNNKGSIIFNGINNYANFGNNNLGVDLIDKSFCLWIYLDSSFSTASGLIDKDFDNGTPNYGGWGFWIQSNRKLWWWNHANLDLLDDGPNVVPLTKWTFVSVTYNSTSKTANFYINAVLNSSKTNASIVEKSSSTTNLILSATRNASGSFLNGRISNVIAYNRELTAKEILQNYNAIKDRFGL